MRNLEALAIARTWIGTPYRHQASLKGVGCDCIGLILGVYRELYGADPQGFKLPPYSPRWAEETGDELMVTLASQYMHKIPLGEQIPGDALMYRMYKQGPTKHAAIYVSPNKVIHAYQGHNVMESNWTTSTSGSTLTHVFRFPNNPSDLME